MGYFAGSINKSQHRVWYSTRRERSVVLSGWDLCGMEIDWRSLVDSWQTYVLLTRPRSSPE
jgi:hypothetical protein